MSDLDTLLGLLDIEDPSDFEYFEQFAELTEMDEELPVEALHALFLGADAAALAAMTESYFDELLRAVPDSAAELYTLLTAIKTHLTGIIAVEEGGAFADLFTEEYLRFRTWYKDDSLVLCTDGRSSALAGDEETQTVSLMEALTSSLLQEITGDDIMFDFTDVQDYELDEYIIPFSHLMDDYDENYDRDEDDWGEDDEYGEVDDDRFDERDDDYERDIEDDY